MNADDARKSLRKERAGRASIKNPMMLRLAMEFTVIATKLCLAQGEPHLPLFRR